MLPSPIAMYCSSGSFGGLEMNTVRLAKWLLQANEQVLLCAVGKSPLQKQANADGVQTLSIPRNKRYGDITGAYRFARQLKRRHITILMIVDNRDLDFAMWVKWFSGNTLITIYQQHMMLGIPRKDILHTMRYRSLNVWITLLPYMAEEIKTKTRYPHERIHIIPLGLEAETLVKMKKNRSVAREELHLPPDIPLLGILGRLDPQKGQHLVIEALAQLRKEGLNLGLLIMGEATKGEHSGYEWELHQRVEEGNMTSVVFFSGYQEDVSLFYSAIDLFVLGSYGETYGMVTIESMLFGVPVVGSDAGGTPELLGNGSYGWLYPPRSVTGMVEAIQKIVQEPESTKKKVALAQQYACTTFSHKTEMTLLKHLLTKLICHENRHPLR